MLDIGEHDAAVSGTRRARYHIVFCFLKEGCAVLAGVSREREDGHRAEWAWACIDRGAMPHAPAELLPRQRAACG